MPNFLYNKNNGRMFEIVGADAASGTITLKNDMATFSDTFDKERFKTQGFFPISGDDEDDARAKAEAKVAADGGEPVQPSKPKTEAPKPVQAPITRGKVTRPVPVEPAEDDDDDMGLGDDDE